MAHLAFAMKLPEAWRLLRLSWRPARMAALALMALILCALLLFITYGESIETQMVAQGAGKIPVRALNVKEFCSSSFSLLMAFQCILWLIILPVQVGTAAISEFQVGTWVFQQTAPQTVRRLLLGKLLGAPGDMFTVAATALPLVFGFAFAAHVPFGNFLCGFALVLILSFAVASLMLFLSFISGKHNSSLIFLAMLGLLYLVVAISSGIAIDGGNMKIFSLIHLMGMAVDPGLIGRNLFQTVEFFGRRVALLPTAMIFYGFIGVSIYLAAEAQALRLMNMPRSRVLLVPLFAIAILLFLGLSWMTPDRVQAMLAEAQKYEYVEMKHVAQPAFAAAAGVYNILFLAMIYGVILLHARPMNDTRPWLYGTVRRGWAVTDLFAPGSPAVFTVAPLLIVVLAGFSILAANYSVLFQYFESPIHTGGIIGLYAAAAAAIIFRDALFLQYARIRFKRGLVAIALIYLVGFVAITIAVNVGWLSLHAPANETMLLDLTPFTAAALPSLITDFSATDRTHWLKYLVSYCVVNGALTAAFGFLVWNSLKKERAKLKKDLEKQNQTA